MIYINKILYTLIALIFFIASSYGEIKDSLFATVGDKAITSSDIVNEIKIILIISNQPYTEEKREKLQSIAVSEVVKRNIKRIEIEKYKSLAFSKFELENELEKLANNINIDLETFKNRFVMNGVKYLDVVENLKTELLWNSLIFLLYKDRLVINVEEIDEQLIAYESKKEINEYLISEIIIKPVTSSELDSEIKKIKNKINNEGFEKTAMDLSISETRVKGGDLGWIGENLITNKFKSEIISTPIGEISKPIILPEGILFFKVRDKRNIKKNLNLDDAKNELIIAEKQKILNMYSLSHYDTLRRSISINYY